MDKVGIKSILIEFIIYSIGWPYHIFTKLIDLCKFKFYFEKFRLRSTILRKPLFDNGVYCIYVIYDNHKLQEDHKFTLNKLIENNVNTLVVNNGKLLKEDYDFLDKNSIAMIDRDNQGRDFGAYKDAFNFLKNTKLQVKKLVFLNDSCFVRERGFDQLIYKLVNVDAEVIAPFETYQHTYHLQSFCFSISGNIYTNKIFENFWKIYRPFNSRYHSIKAGEVGLTKTLKRITKDIEVLFPTSEENIVPDFIINGEINPSSFNLLPSRSREKILKSLAKIDDTDPNYKKYIVNELAAKEITKSNAAHYFASLASFKLNNPLLKKDIFYRQIFNSYYETDRVLKSFYQDDNQDLLEYAIKNIRFKGHSMSGKNIFRMILISRGFI